MTHYWKEREAEQAAEEAKIFNSYEHQKQVRIDAAINAMNGKYPGIAGCDFLSFGQPLIGYLASRQYSPKGLKPICTRAEFESRKAERQGKPDWKDAPEWANWLAQDSGGSWHWYPESDFRPETGRDCFYNSADRHAKYASNGEVIGNWQDTLEQRPEHIRPAGDMGVAPKLEGVGTGAGSPEKAVAEVLQAEVERMRNFLSIIASNEALLNKIANPKPAKADWYDYDNQQALKLPPVGELIEAAIPHTNGRGEKSVIWIEGRVIAHREFKSKVYSWFAEDGDNGFYQPTAIQLQFRPLDWERNQPKVEPEQSPKLSFHLATAQNELQASAKLLPAESKLLQSITGAIGAIQAIREAV